MLYLLSDILFHILMHICITCSFASCDKQNSKMTPSSLLQTCFPLECKQCLWIALNRYFLCEVCSESKIMRCFIYVYKQPLIEQWKGIHHVMSEFHSQELMVASKDSDFCSLVDNQEGNSNFIFPTVSLYLEEDNEPKKQ